MFHRRLAAAGKKFGIKFGIRFGIKFGLNAEKVLELTFVDS